MAPVMQALVDAGQRTRLFATWLDALDRENPDIAVVNPPFYLLAAVTKECLARGIHVFAEKPFAITTSDLAALRKLAFASGAPKLMAMFTMRYTSEFLAGHQFVTLGGIGNPISVKAHKSYPLMGWDGNPRPWFYHHRTTYGGTIPWIGVHAIDLIRWFSGSAFTQVKAVHSTVGNEGHGEMEATADMEFKLASGALAEVHLDFLRKRQYGPWGDDRLRVRGDRGVLEIQDGRIKVQTGTGEFRELDQEPVPSMFAAFLLWVERDIPMLLSTEDCFIATEIALLARDSADQGKVLPL